jgi:hypothetical protein
MTEKDESPEPYLVPEKDGDGMTVWRLAEIEEAEKAGRPLDLTEAERAQVKESRSSVRNIMAGIGATAGIDWAKMTEKLGAISAPHESAAEMAMRIMPNPPYVPDFGIDTAAVGAAEGRFSATAPVSDLPKTSTYTRAGAYSNGFLTLLSDGERLTGAYALGQEAGEWLQQATLAIRARVPIDVLSDTIQPFPTSRKSMSPR